MYYIIYIYIYIYTYIHVALIYIYIYIYIYVALGALNRETPSPPRRTFFVLLLDRFMCYVYVYVC